MNAKSVSPLLVALGLLAAPMAHAGFIGKNVTADYLYPDTSTVYESHSATVGAGSEFTFTTLDGDSNTDDLLVDLDDLSVTITDLIQLGWTSATFNGLRLSDTNGTIDPIASVTLATNSWTGFDASRISFDANNIWVNLQSLDPGGSVTLDVTFRPGGNGNGNGVPEPATLALLGLGLAGLGLSRKRTA